MLDVNKCLALHKLITKKDVDEKKGSFELGILPAIALHFFISSELQARPSVFLGQATGRQGLGIPVQSTSSFSPPVSGPLQ
jgi:hypothetical protein